jgi:hypothetical protein
MSTYRDILSKIENMPEATLLDEINWKWLNNPVKGVSQFITLIVVPTSPLDSADQLQEFLESLLPEGAQPYSYVHCVDFPEQGKMQVGKLDLAEIIGVVKKVVVLTDPDLAEDRDLYDTTTNLVRKIVIRVFPSVASIPEDIQTRVMDDADFVYVAYDYA